VQTPLMNALSHATNRLRWSSRSLTREVHIEATILELNATVLKVPKICENLRSWSHSHYRGEPSSLVEEAHPNFYTAHGIIKSLEQYEGPRLRAYSKRVRRLEARASKLNDNVYAQIAMSVEAGLAG
jgi:hypothetical protein